jgi:hypothetical protein
LRETIFDAEDMEGCLAKITQICNSRDLSEGAAKHHRLAAKSVQNMG